MAELVGIYAASHGPLIARDWAKLPETLRAQLTAAYGEIAARLRASRADTLIVLAPDHWTNFFLDNLPALCIGVGAEHLPPPEPFLADFAAAHPTLPGAPELGRHLLTHALAHGFEPAQSHRLRLDHGICLPLMRLALAPLPRLVPILINSLDPPMLSLPRSLAWGRLLREAVASFPAAIRVAILATGGLSHSIGEPSMGAIDEPADRATLAALVAGDDLGLLRVLEGAIPQAGNGMHEVRNWLVAHGAAGSRGFREIAYLPAPELYLGCAFGAWTA